MTIELCCRSKPPLTGAQIDLLRRAALTMKFRTVEPDFRDPNWMLDIERSVMMKGQMEPHLVITPRSTAGGWWHQLRKLHVCRYIPWYTGPTKDKWPCDPPCGVPT